MKTKTNTNTAQALPALSALLVRITDSTGLQFLARTYVLEQEQGDGFRLFVAFWNSVDRDTGLGLILSALVDDGFAVVTQSSNLLDLSEVELILAPTVLEEGILTDQARKFDASGYQVGEGAEIEVGTFPNGLRWVRIGRTLHQWDECVLDANKGTLRHLPSGNSWAWRHQAPPWVCV